MSRIALVGTYPPPIGGVSIHIYRLRQALIQQGMDILVYDTSTSSGEEDGILPGAGRRQLLFKLFSSRAGILHYHNHDWTMRALLLLLKVFSKKVIFTFHSFRDDLQATSLPNKFLIRLVARWGDCFIATNSDIKEKLILIGANPNKIKVVPAFLPPQLSEQAFGPVPDEASDFMKTHEPLISANAYRISFFGGQDLYGIDLCIDLCHALKKDWPEVGLIFCLPTIGDTAYYSKLQARIHDLGIDENFLFVSGPVSLPHILEQSDLFIRPTNTDSYGVSVAEALYLGTPAIASDVCERPTGTMLFPSRDLEELTHLAKKVLEDSKSGKLKRNRYLHDVDYLQPILEIYQSLEAVQ
jgi:glycosyltransferase involved in cell wall biosynthesis